MHGKSFPSGSGVVDHRLDGCGRDAATTVRRLHGPAGLEHGTSWRVPSPVADNADAFRVPRNLDAELHAITLAFEAKIALVPCDDLLIGLGPAHLIHELVRVRAANQV